MSSKSLFYVSLFAIAVISSCANNEDVLEMPVDPYNGHEYVDLGLTSGLKWATMNVGANSPSDYGEYYAWGEKETKDLFQNESYKYYDIRGKLTKYCTGSSKGSVDNKTTLEPKDDVAHVKWGGKWRMPTQAEVDELIGECTRQWAVSGGHEGIRFVGPNGKSIFLPTAGMRVDNDFDIVGYAGYYWSSSLSVEENYGDSYACSLYFRIPNRYLGPHCSTQSFGRLYGFSIRPVCP